MDILLRTRRSVDWNTKPWGTVPEDKSKPNEFRISIRLKNMEFRQGDGCSLKISNCVRFIFYNFFLISIK